jgi:SAM-dependent methyltransferase
LQGARDFRKQPGVAYKSYVSQADHVGNRRLRRVLVPCEQLPIFLIEGFIMNQQEIIHWQQKTGLTYHVPYALEGERRIGLEGKHVLEIGGRLPKSFVFDGLNVKSWTAIEAPDYMRKHGSSGLTAQIGGDELYNDDLSLASDNFLPGNGSYDFFHYAIEDIPPCMTEKFDAIFSIACFEHIQDLGRALDGMYQALKPGGLVFSMFSPIWSSFNGHHLPKITDKKNNTYFFNDSPIPPWGHLLLRPPEMYDFLCGHTDKETAAKIVYYIYHAPIINRYFTEDYLKYFNKCSFTVKECNVTFQNEMKEELITKLKRLHPQTEFFNNQGILVVLSKE